MANFAFGMIGPWLPRRALLDISPHALAAQGGRIATTIARQLERQDLDKRPASQPVRVTLSFTGPEAPSDLLDLVAGVEPFVIEALVRHGLFARAQLEAITHEYRRTSSEGFLLAVYEDRPAA